MSRLQRAGLKKEKDESGREAAAEIATSNPMFTRDTMRRLSG